MDNTGRENQSSEAPYEGLSPDLIMDAVESVGLLPDARMLALNSYENRVYQVGIEDQEPVIAKFYRPGRWTEAQILEEHAFTWELAELEIPVVPPWRNGQGNTLHYYQGFFFALFPRRGGRSPDVDNLDHLEILGRYLGRIHRVGQLRKFEHRPDFSVTRFARESAAFILESGMLPADLEPAYRGISEELISALDARFKACSSVRWIRLHGDCHMGNVLWRDDRPHFVDFDDTLNGPAIQDLWMLLSGDRQERLLQLDTLVSAYEEFCEFDARELSLIESLRTLRLMHYSAWLARRWHDPAFTMAFPWFNTARYWAEHILELKEQRSALDEPNLTLGL